MTPTEAINTLREALEKAAKTFRWYEELHAAKPDMEKAARNAEFAEQMEEALPAVSYLETALQPKSEDLPDVVKFLLGEGTLKGFSFGEYPDNGERYKRKYWWRKHLRAEIDRLMLAMQPKEMRSIENLVQQAIADLHVICAGESNPFTVMSQNFLNGQPVDEEQPAIQKLLRQLVQDAIRSAMHGPVSKTTSSTVKAISKRFDEGTMSPHDIDTLMNLADRNVQIPEDYHPVPKEPTHEILCTIVKCTMGKISMEKARKLYQELLAAAPQPTASEEKK